MKANINIVKNGLLILIFAVLFFPLIQSQLKLIKIWPLHGDIVISENPVLSFDSWLQSTYQEKKEIYENSNFGFREVFVKLHNQIKFSLFRLPTAFGVIIGKENYFYEENYIKAYTGADFLGEDSLSRIVNKIKFISDTLSKLNKQLLIILAAGKASYYPEYIPDSYLPIKGKTNYMVLSGLLKESGINHIDFNGYFTHEKLKSKYPLYPQYGIHWSAYGTAIVADSIIKKIEFLRGIDMPNLIYNEIELKPPFDIDYDIASGMNLLFKLKSFDMAYPKIKTEEAENKIKPTVLVISDSFYWGMYGFGIGNSFSNDHFWYYNKQVYPETFKKEIFVENLNFENEIRKQDVIIVMATEATLSKIGWGFFEMAEKHFKGIKINNCDGVELVNQLEVFKNAIRGDLKWMKQIEGKANSRGISIDSMLTTDALWLMNQKSINN
jgi:hypothetical protein